MDSRTGKHQLRGGGNIERKNRPHRYATKDVVQPASPTWLKARAARKLKV